MNDQDHYKTAVFKTPFHSRTAALCQTNEWHRWKDYTVADRYFDTELEYFAIRNSAAVFDLTPMTKHRISGPDALPFLDRLLTRDLTKLRPGRVAYCVWCDDAGQVIDDGTVFHLQENVYRLCSQERQLDWLHASALGFDVEIYEETHDVAGLALQGPTSCAVLKRLGLEDIELLKPFDLAHFPFEGGELMVSRTGFTGDLGYELWVDPTRAETLWDSLFEAGRLHGITPMGTHALDMARIEAGFIQCGVDFLPAHQTVRPGRSRSPYELGLGWLVNLQKPNFTGRRALLRERERGARFRLVRLNIEGNKPANDAFIYNWRKKAIGTVTSAMWSPTCKANIALASVEMPYGKLGDRLWAEIYYNRELKWKRVWARATVVKGTFFNLPRRNATPALDF